MIALRPPSYHTIEDPPPYPDDDDDDNIDDCPLVAAGDKRLSSGSTTATRDRARDDRLPVNFCQRRQLRDYAADERLTQQTVDDVVRQFRDAVRWRRRRLDPPTCRRSVVSQADYPQAPWAWANRGTCRLDSSDIERYEQQRHQVAFDRTPARSGISPTTVQTNNESPLPVGVPYSVTCPSCFDGYGLDDSGVLGGPGHAQPVDRRLPRPSSSGEPVARGRCLRRDDRTRESHQTSVFEISSYIIGNGPSSGALVQPTDAV